MHDEVFDAEERWKCRKKGKQMLAVMKSELTNTEIIETVADIEDRIKAAEPKVDMIFLETAGIGRSKAKTPDLQHTD